MTLSKFVFQLILSPIFPELKLVYNILRNLACVGGVNYPRLVTSANGCTQRIAGSEFGISFHLDWQIDNGFSNRLITAHTQILVLS